MCKYVHHYLEIDEKARSFKRHVNSYLVQHFPEVLEGLKTKENNIKLMILVVV
jgi:hypothetical protein